MHINSNSWLKNVAIYEVFVRNYSKDGNFDAVYNDLERIKDLGIDIIWLMPIMPSGKKGKKGSCGSPYAIRNFGKIDEEYGTEKELKKLIKKAHNLGIKVIIDIVFHHTSMDSEYIKSNPEWYSKDIDGNFTRKFEDWSDIYDLDLMNEGLRKASIKSLEYWLDLGVDGFRCDIAAMIPLEFWKEVIEKINMKYKNVIWLAETIEKSFIKSLRENDYTALSDPEMHQIFDVTYDYDGFEYIKEFFKGNLEIKDLIHYLFIQDTLYPAGAIKMRFIENHDQYRIANIIQDKTLLKNWTIFYMFLPGAILIHSGQEFRLKENNDIFENDPIEWGLSDKEFNDFFKKVIYLSKKIKIKCEKFSISLLTKNVVKINWNDGDEKYIVIVNLGKDTGFVFLNYKIKCEDLLSGEIFNFGGNLSISLEPLILKELN